MPYIEQSGRVDVGDGLEKLIAALNARGWQPGEVNYSIYKILLAWWRSEPRYKTICSIMGTLSSVSNEFYRKVAAPYEDGAEKKNGEIT